MALFSFSWSNGDGYQDQYRKSELALRNLV